MRLFGPGYRDLPRFWLRRLDHAAGQLNAFLLLVALTVAMLDLLFLVQKLIDALPPTIATGTSLS